MYTLCTVHCSSLQEYVDRPEEVEIVLLGEEVRYNRGLYATTYNVSPGRRSRNGAGRAPALHPRVQHFTDHGPRILLRRKDGGGSRYPQVIAAIHGCQVGQVR